MGRITFHATDPVESVDTLLKRISGFTSVPATKMVAVYYQSDGSLNVVRTEMSQDELHESLYALSKEVNNKTN